MQDERGTGPWSRVYGSLRQWPRSLSPESDACRRGSCILSSRAPSSPVPSSLDGLASSYGLCTSRGTLGAHHLDSVPSYGYNLRLLRASYVSMPNPDMYTISL